MIKIALNDQEKVIDLMKRLRAELGWTQEQLADQTGENGLHRLSILNLEHGKSEPKPTNLGIICRAMGVETIFHCVPRGLPSGVIGLRFVYPLQEPIPLGDMVRILCVVYERTQTELGEQLGYAYPANFLAKQRNVDSEPLFSTIRKFLSLFPVDTYMMFTGIPEASEELAAAWRRTKAVWSIETTQEFHYDVTDSKDVTT